MDITKTMNPITQLDEIKGIGSRYLERLQKLGIFFPIDVLFHLPTSYQDRTTLTSIGCASVIQSKDYLERASRNLPDAAAAEERR